MLYLIGIGLGKGDISLKALEAIKKCSLVYLENYTSVIDYDIEEIIGKKVIKANRDLVEKEEEVPEHTSASQHVTLSVYGLLGHAVLYEEETLNVENNLETPAPTCDFAISSSDAAKMALDQYRKTLLEHGLRTRSHPHAKEISEVRKIYYPFWMGYFLKKKGFDFKALDAVSGEIQGVRMRRLFIRALKSLE